MASNPECCLTLEEWKCRFDRWIEQGTPENLIKASIFFGSRASNLTTVRADFKSSITQHRQGR